MGNFHQLFILDQKRTLYIRDAYTKFSVSTLINIKEILDACARNGEDAKNKMVLCITRETEYHRNQGGRFREHFQEGTYFRNVNPGDWVAVADKSKALRIIRRLYDVNETGLSVKFYNTKDTKTDYLARQKDIPFFSMESNTWTPVGHITGYRPEKPFST